MENVNGIILTHSNTHESFRLIRLKKVCAIWEILSNGEHELVKPKQIHEHKGCLEVYFDHSNKISDTDKETLKSIWELFNEYEITFNK